MSEPDDRDEETAQRRSMLLMIAAAFTVVVVGGWLAFAIHDYLAQERCQIEGHRYCDGPPIEIPH